MTSPAEHVETEETRPRADLGPDSTQDPDPVADSTSEPASAQDAESAFAQDAEPALAQDAEPDSQPSAPPLDPDVVAAFPGPRLARIAASIDLEPAARDAILASSQLDEWQLVALLERDAHQTSLALRRGDGALLTAFDEAYVDRIEEERGPLEDAERRRLIEAFERDDVARVCGDLEVPEVGLVRVLRVLERRRAAAPLQPVHSEPS